MNGKRRPKNIGACDRIRMYSNKAQCGVCRSIYVEKESHVAPEKEMCTKIATDFSHLAVARSNTCNTNEDSLQTCVTNAKQKNTIVATVIERPTGYV